MSMYKQFGTDPNAEVHGVWIDYGEFRVLIARAGGANVKFKRVLDAKSKPYRRAIETDTLNDKIGDRLLRETYAEAVIKGWEVLVDGEWKPGIEASNGDLLPVNKENLLSAFDALPDLFMDLVSQAGKAALYRRANQEVEAGN